MKEENLTTILVIMINYWDTRELKVIRTALVCSTFIVFQPNALLVVVDMITAGAPLLV